jgi:AcrR family transcriptional regulator
MSADERRELVLEAAAKEFAMSGFAGTSADAIARTAGISQPYLFRLFGTKVELFLAVVERSFSTLMAALQEAAEGASRGQILDEMSRAYDKALPSPYGPLEQLQLYAACGDEEVRVAVRRGFAECYQYVERASGASAEEVRGFFAEKMLDSVAAAMRLDDVAGREAWARGVLGRPR